MAPGLEELGLRPRAISREGEKRRRCGEVAAPEPGLPLEPVARERVALPVGEIAVLERKRCQVRLPACEERLVRACELAEEDLDGPGVEGDVMRLKEHDVVVRGEAEERRAQQEIAAQVEAGGARTPAGAGRHLRRCPPQSTTGTSTCQCSSTTCSGRLVVDPEDGAQRLVTLDQHLERAGQGVPVE